ncbi:5-formyltetrahydrofolate cyclo-ligase [Massilia sp. P8910]|uniref:5-formyltetrahydrofolate cyclo-ligase n=1 Tax=Massilia antarctica TaxID=2765360 RepID=UPI0009E6F9EE|nr:MULTISPECIES: 5-formyltetrahydrofolate cyclo-ligase [Massilia]MCE3607858.1 5-formyltetrahydrofolate cyclo-ligase [Massilia antarctica]MCY0911883.1 5-formyltetrahydrofolate cyclo-ligase [Massilia sp. H27-R4]
MTGEPRIPCGPAALPASANANAAFAHGADKAALRAMLKAARRALDPAQKAQRDAAIGARVLAWWRDRAAGGGAAPLGVYWPLRGEPDLHPVYADLARAGVRLALPLVVAPDTALAFVEWVPGEDMLSDRMGVAVPARRRVLERPPVLLVPCLGFTAERYRLGYGGGYYDRTLEALPRPYTVGIAYAGDRVEFAGARHDVALDVVMTEEWSDC